MVLVYPFKLREFCGSVIFPSSTSTQAVLGPFLTFPSVMPHGLTGNPNFVVSHQCCSAREVAFQEQGMKRSLERGEEK